MLTSLRFCGSSLTPDGKPAPPRPTRPLALIAAISVFAIFSGGWRKTVAKRFVEAYRDERVLDKLQNNINTYWSDTQTAFNASADNLNAEWKKHIEELREKLQSYDVDAILSAKEEAERMRNFLQNIPF